MGFWEGLARVELLVVVVGICFGVRVTDFDIGVVSVVGVMLVLSTGYDRKEKQTGCNLFRKHDELVRGGKSVWNSDDNV